MLEQAASDSEFIIAESRKFMLFINGIHLIALAACWLNALPWLYQLILSALVCLSRFKQQKTLQNNKIILRYTPMQEWLIYTDSDTDSQAVKIESSSFVSSLLMILHVTIENRKRSVVIFDDVMNVDAYRRLMILLKTTGCIAG